MSRRQHAVFVGDQRWRLAVVEGDEADVAVIDFAAEAPLEQRIDALKQQLAAREYEGEPVALVLPSSWCLSARVSTEQLERGGRRRAMGFRLEEHLPISYEDVIADFLDGQGGEALGVCGDRDTLVSLVDAFESADVTVRHICPEAFLAAAYAVETNTDVDGVLMGRSLDEAEGYDLVELQGDKPARWWWLSTDSSAVREHLTDWSAGRERTTRLATMSCNIARLNGSLTGNAIEPVELLDTRSEVAAARQAARLLAGTATPWIELRRDALAAPDRFEVYRKPLIVLIAAAALLLVCISAAAVYRGGRYEALQVQHQADQVAVYRNVTGSGRAPTDVRMALLREQRKLAGLRGQAGDATSRTVIEFDSALLHLHRVLSALPRDLRYRVLDLNIQPNVISLDGEARSHAEADRLSVALRASGQYDVDPPKTQALRERGVRFTFSAKPRAKAADEGGER